MTQAPAATPWQTGRLGSAKGPQRVLFGQMYEDPVIECDAFAGKPRVFCIASAGDTALQLAAHHQVVACDINPVQLAYAEHRALGAPAIRGVAEKAMNFVRAFRPLIGWRRSTLQSFLALSNTAEQAEFFHRRLDTRRFRTGFDLLLSRPVLRAVYAPQFLAFLPPRFGCIVRQRLECGFSTHPNATNRYARALLLGDLLEAPTPAHAHANIKFVLADAASYLESCPEASFDAFALSNILDGATPTYRDRLFRAVRHAAAPEALLTLRSFAEPSSNLVTNHAARDRALLWGTVEVRPVQSL